MATTTTTTTTAAQPDFSKLEVKVVVKTEKGYYYCKLKQRAGGSDPKVNAANGQVNALIQKAAIQPTLGSMLKVTGVEHYLEKGHDIETVAVQDTLAAIMKSGLLSDAAYRTLFYALKGHADEGFIPGGWANALATAGAVFISPFLAAAKLVYDITTEPLSVQDKSKYKMTVAEALDALAVYDPPAADLLTDVILERQKQFEATYTQNFFSWAAGKVWRGLKTLIEVVVAGTVAAAQWVAEQAAALASGLVKAAASAIPWWVWVGGIGTVALGGYLVFKNRKVIVPAVAGAAVGGPAGAALAVAGTQQARKNPVHVRRHRR
jgi:hypothetical protein